MFVRPLGHVYGEGNPRPWEGALKQRKGVAFPAQNCLIFMDILQLSLFYTNFAQGY